MNADTMSANDYIRQRLTLDNVPITAIDDVVEWVEQRITDSYSNGYLDAHRLRHRQ